MSVRRVAWPAHRRSSRRPSASAMGSRILKVVPSDTADSTSIDPPWASTIERVIDRPRPAPPAWRDRLPSLAEEAVEHLGGDLRRHAGPVVGHRDRGPTLVAARLEVERRRRWRVDERVVHQRPQDLPEPGLVTDDHERLGGDGGGDEAFGLHGATVTRGVAQHVDEVDRLTLQGSTLVEVGEQQQVLDQAGHPLGLGTHAADDVIQLARRAEATVVIHLEVPPHRGQGRAQLVRGVGDESAQGLLLAVPLIQHHVERLRQAGRLGPGPIGFHPLPAIAGGDRVGHRSHLRDRAQPEPVHPPAGHAEHEHDDRAGEAEGDQQGAVRGVDVVEGQRDHGPRVVRQRRGSDAEPRRGAGPVGREGPAVVVECRRRPPGDHRHVVQQLPGDDRGDRRRRRPRPHEELRGR